MRNTRAARPGGNAAGVAGPGGEGIGKEGWWSGWWILAEVVGGTWCKWAGPMFARASCPACSFGSVALVVMVCADGAEAQGRQADDSGLIVGCAHCLVGPSPRALLRLR